jgi:hypothetical protein
VAAAPALAIGAIHHLIQVASVTLVALALAAGRRER